MELSRATIDQMTEELRRRHVEFALIVSPTDIEAPHPEDYKVYSSAELGEHSIGEAVRCLIGGLTVLTSLVEEVDEQGDEKASCFWRWVAVGETLLNDIFRTTEEWCEEDQNGSAAR